MHEAILRFDDTKQPVYIPVSRGLERIVEEIRNLHSWDHHNLLYLNFVRRDDGTLALRVSTRSPSEKKCLYSGYCIRHPFEEFETMLNKL